MRRTFFSIDDRTVVVSDDMQQVLIERHSAVADPLVYNVAPEVLELLQIEMLRNVLQTFLGFERHIEEHDV